MRDPYDIDERERAIETAVTVEREATLAYIRKRLSEKPLRISVEDFATMLHNEIEQGKHLLEG